ncbi:MAG: hypothetical protein J6K43_12890 [Lachnospiraceae bacterium]|nr:hypothetical protein [Lachnospiraceae bacterium]
MQSELSIEDVKWALLVVGIGLIIWGIHDLGYVNKTPVNIADLQSYDIQSGMVVEGEIPCNYGVFDKEVQYKNDGPNENRYYYLIPVGNNSYMGYLSTTSDENLKRQAQETEQYINGTRMTAPSSVWIHGYVRPMDASTKAKMRSYMISLGVPSDQVDSILVDYYIQCAYFSAWKTVLIIGIIMTGVGAVMIISQYSMRIKK